MTFQVKANPTVRATLTIAGQGREQQLDLVYRHQTKDHYLALLDELSQEKTDAAVVLLQLVESWDADVPLDAAGVATLQQEQPGADWAIISGWGQAMAVARKGN